MNQNRLEVYLLCMLGTAALSWLMATNVLFDVQPPYARWLAHAAGITPKNPWLLLALAIGAALGYLLAGFIQKHRNERFGGERFHKFLRGTRTASARALASETRERGKQQISIGGVPMPTKAENVNSLVVGSIGKGKSVCIKSMISQIVPRRDRMAVVDPNGDYLSRFYLPGDVILNPFDARSEGWSIFNELWDAPDYAEYAKSIIPESPSADGEEWAGYARVLFAETARALAMRGKNNTEDLIDHLTRVPFDELKPMLMHTAAAPLFAADVEKARGSIRFTLSKFLTPHQYLRPGSFSIRRWLLDPNAGNLYITWRSDMMEALRPLISTWTDVLCKGVLAREENENNRIWFFLDELPALQMLPSLAAAATMGRKFGLRIVAGLQSVSQLEKLYGAAGARELRSNFLNQLVFGGATADAETAQEMANGLGEREVRRARYSTGYSASGYNTNKSVETVREPVVLPSEITSLPKLTCILKFDGNYPIAKVRFTPQNYAQRTEGIVER